MEVLCFKEHHLKGDWLAHLQNLFWSQAQFFDVKAEARFSNNLARAGAATQGVCMWGGSKAFALGYQFGQFRRDRAQWIRFGGLLEGDLVVLNIYAANNVRNRWFLWEELLDIFPQDCKWIICWD